MVMGMVKVWRDESYSSLLVIDLIFGYYMLCRGIYRGCM